MESAELITGLWRVVSIVQRAPEIDHDMPYGNGITHYYLADGLVRCISRTDVLTNGPSYSYQVSGNILLFTPVAETIDGRERFRFLPARGVFAVDGRAMILTFDVSDSDGQKIRVMMLERQDGPVPEGKQPAGFGPIDDPLLGRLIWYDTYNWYDGSIGYKRSRFSLRRSRIKINLSAMNPEDLEIVISRARKVVTSIQEYVELATLYALEHLLQRAEAWRDDDDKRPMTPRRFRAAMKLQSISFRPDGSVEFWHDDGYLFCGHFIEIQIDREDKLVRADIPG